MPAALDLAAASNTDLAKASEISAGALAAFGLEAGQMRGKANAMGKAFQRMNLGQNLNVFGTQFAKTAGAAKAAGIDFNEYVAAIGAQGNAGMLKSAGTNIGNVIKAMTDSGKRAKLASRGIDVFGDNGKLSMVKMAEGLRELQGTMSEADFASFTQDLFGTQGGRGAAALVSQLDKMKSALKEMGAAEAGAGKGDFLSSMVATQQQGLEGAIARMKSSLEGLKLEIFESGFGAAAEGAVNMVAKLATGLTNLVANVPGLGPVLGIFGAIAAAIGPVLVVIGTVGPAIAKGFSLAVAAAGAFKAGLAGIGAAIAGVAGVGLAPILAIVAAIAAVGLAVYKFWPAIQAFFTGIAQGFSSAMASVGGFGALLSTAFEPLFTALAPAIQMVQSALAGLFSQSQAGVGTMTSLGQAIGVGLAVGLQIVASGISLVVQGFVMVGQVIGTVLGMFAQFGSEVMLALSTIPSRLALIGAQIKAGFVAAFQGIVALITPIITSIGTAFQGLVMQVMAIGMQIRTAFTTAFAAIALAIMPVITSIGTAFQGLVTTIVAIASTVGSTLSSALAGALSVIQGAVASIGAAFGQLPGVISGVVSQAVGIISGAAGMFRSAGAALMQALAAGIQSAVGAAISAVSGAVSSIRGMLPFSPAKYGPLSDLDKTGPALIATFADGINPRPLTRALAPALEQFNQILPSSLGRSPTAKMLVAHAPVAMQLPQAPSALSNAPRVADPATAHASTASHTSNSSVSINFAPVIHASNADGVRGVLEDEADRLLDMVDRAIADRSRLAY